MESYMRRFTKYLFDKSGYTAKADGIQKKIGVQAVDYSSLTFKNRKGWAILTIFWTDLASMPYFQTRALKIRESVPDYKPDIVVFEPLFYGSPQKTIEFLEKLDTLFLQATGSPCPDTFFEYTFPPDIGPYEDLLKTVINEKLVINAELLNPIYLNIALSLSQQDKNVFSSHSLTPADMVFLGRFVCFVHTHEAYHQFLKKYKEDELALRFIYLSFAPDHKLHHLDWNAKLITECFDRVVARIELYDKKPEIAKMLFLTEKELMEKGTDEDFDSPE
jgi:hypothetical protein